MSDAEILRDTSPAAMAHAAQASLMALNRLVSRSPKAEVFEAPGFFRWQTPIPHPYFNGVVVSEPPGRGAEALARKALDYFAGKNVSAITWWFEPSVSAEAWTPLLLSLGLTLDPNLPGMAVSLDDLADDVLIDGEGGGGAPALEIRQVGNSAMLREWTEVFIEGYELPASTAAPLFEVYDDLHEPGSPLQSYGAYLDGNLVATSSIFYGVGVAGIYDVATIPSARGRGIGAAVTLAPLREARARGYRIGVLQSSLKGLPVYERLGFRTVCRIPHFNWSAPA